MATSCSKAVHHTRPEPDLGAGKLPTAEVEPRETGSCGVAIFGRCSKLTGFAAVYSITSLSTFMADFYFTSQLSTLQKQFGLSSQTMGLVMSCMDVGYVLPTLFISFIARRVHIPRVLALSTFLHALSSILCTLPHFASRQTFTVLGNWTDHNVTSRSRSEVPLCVLDLGDLSNYSSSQNDLCASKSQVSGQLWESEAWTKKMAVVTFAIALLIKGVARSPRMPLFLTFLDDNAARGRSPLLAGSSYAVGCFGPALAFGMGSAFSTLHVSLQDTGLSTNDPRWIGAWWLGFLTLGSLVFVSGLPLLAFPRTLTPWQPDAATAGQTIRKASKAVINFSKEMVQTLWRVLSNPIFMCLLFGDCVSLFGWSGFSAFSAKYMESQFFLPVWRANLFLGGLMIAGSSVGIFLGGYLTTKLKLTPQQCLKMSLTVTGMGTVFTLVLAFLGCQQPILPLDSKQWDVGVQIPGCNVSCKCDDVNFFAVCGSDDVTYFSPCHAGCSQSDGKNFFNCSCVGDGVNLGTPGFCQKDCPGFIAFFIVSFLNILVFCLSAMPLFAVYTRCVSEKDKPLALGLRVFCISLIGLAPSPVVAGKIIDSTCRSWSTSCSGTGECALYDTGSWRVRMHLSIGALNAVGVASTVTAFFLSHRLKEPFKGENFDRKAMTEKGNVSEMENLAGE